MAGGFRISTQKKHIRQKRRVKASLDLVIVEKNTSAGNDPFLAQKEIKLIRLRYMYIYNVYACFD